MSLFFFVKTGRSNPEVWTVPTATASDNETAPTDAQAGWVFNTDGTIDIYQGGSAYHSDFSSQATTPIADLWMRLTYAAGDAHTSGGLVAGTWYKVVGTGSTLRQFYWDYTFTSGNTTGSVTVDLSTDSGGATIVATGILGGEASVEP